MPRSRVLVLQLILLGAVLASPSAAEAATCADYANQAQAQRAKDTRNADGKLNGPLPDARCTPGAYFKNADRAHICRSGYSASVRNVSQALKERVFAEYGITVHSGRTYEVDHLVPLELGGSNSIANLFPEAASPTPGFHQKDRLENRAHARVCAGARGLRATQRSIADDWTVLYAAYFE